VEGSGAVGLTAVDEGARLLEDGGGIAAATGKQAFEVGHGRVLGKLQLLRFALQQIGDDAWNLTVTFIGLLPSDYPRAPVVVTTIIGGAATKCKLDYTGVCQDTDQVRVADAMAS
jgi:hypothetical protein